MASLRFPRRTAADDTNTADKKEAAVSFLIFGARPSNLFDDIAITIEKFLVDEVTSLPLLPRTLTESNEYQSGEGGSKVKPKTGEEKIMGNLLLAYKKNLDLGEAYCSRNIFTIQYHPKTMRRKILENYLAQENEKSCNTEKEEDGKNNNPPTPLPATTFLIAEEELPLPAQMIGTDKEILVARQRLQHAKRRRIQLKFQLDRLAKASQPLVGVQEALTNYPDVESNREGEGIVASVQTLKEMVATAMEGHHELRGWNSRAEEVLQILDKIKVERSEMNNPLGKNTGRSVKIVVGREADERERRRMLAYLDGNTVSHGSKEHVASLLKKLRGTTN